MYLALKIYCKNLLETYDSSAKRMTARAIFMLFFFSAPVSSRTINIVKARQENIVLTRDKNKLKPCFPAFFHIGKIGNGVPDLHS